MPPFTPKEIFHYFLWIAIVAIALGAIVWFAFYSTGNKTVPLTRGTAAVMGSGTPVSRG